MKKSGDNAHSTMATNIPAESVPGSPIKTIVEVAPKKQPQEEKSIMAKTFSNPTNMSAEADQSKVAVENPADTCGPQQVVSQQFSIANTRSRRDRPCDACRRRKTRCVLNEGSDVCVLCRFHNQDCTFLQLPLPRKRRLPTAGSEGKRDRAKSQDKEKDQETERSGREAVKKSRNFNEGDLWQSLKSPRKRYHSSSPPPPTTRIRNVAPVDDYPNLLGPSLLKHTLGLQKNLHSFLVGPTSEYESILIDLCPLDSKDEFSLSYPRPGSSFRRVSIETTFLMLTDRDGADPEFDQELSDVDAIEEIVTPHGQALINLYFKIVHPSFPILHKRVFLEKYARTHREFAPPLLAAVYILALNWWKYDSELCKLDTARQPDVHKLEKLASKCMTDVINRPKLSTVQAGLLLLQRLGMATSSGNWAMTAQLVAIGQELGLHLDCTDWKIPVWEKGLRKRLAWALFMQDKWGALTHGRPSHITSSNWDVRPLSTEDFPENAKDEDDEEGSSEVEKGKMLFMEMIKLTQITADILEGFFTVEAGKYLDGKINKVLERAKPMQIRLKEWHSRLPDVLRMDATRVRKLNSNGYLHLAYFATEITLHRQILRTLCPPPATPQPTNVEPYLVHICRSAAKTRLISAMDFVNRLKPEHLQSFWYFASKVNFALIGTFGSLLWATSPNVAEAEFYKARLAEYRWTLRVSAKAAEFMEFAVGVLDSGIGRVQQEEWQRRSSRVVVEGGTVGVGEGVGPGMIGLGMGSPDSETVRSGSGAGDSPKPNRERLSISMMHKSSLTITVDEMDHEFDGTEDEEDDEEEEEVLSRYGFRIADGDIDMEFSGDGPYDPDASDDNDSDQTARSPRSPMEYPGRSPPAAGQIKKLPGRQMRASRSYQQYQKETGAIPPSYQSGHSPHPYPQPQQSPYNQQGFQRPGEGNTGAGIYFSNPATDGNGGGGGAGGAGA